MRLRGSGSTITTDVDRERRALTQETSSEGSPLRRFLSCEGRLGVCVDFDGTLSPIVARPELATIVGGGREALALLVSRFPVVAVVSGRTRLELEALIGVPGVRLVGSYGLEGAELAASALEQVRAAAGAVPGSYVEPKGASVAVHVRGAEDPDAAEVALAEPLATIGRAHGLEVIEGKRVLELVPAGSPLKGGAVDRLVSEEHLDALLYAGDDVADLRAFAALDRAAATGVPTVKVAVRGEETPVALAEDADLVVDGPGELVRFLARLEPAPTAD